MISHIQFTTEGHKGKGIKDEFRIVIFLNSSYDINGSFLKFNSFIAELDQHFRKKIWAFL